MRPNYGLTSTDAHGFLKKQLLDELSEFVPSPYHGLSREKARRRGAFSAHAFPRSDGILNVANTMLPFIVITGLFAAIYRIMPNARIEWRDGALGAAVTSLLFTVGKLLIGLYLGNASLASTYGAAASIVLLIVWVIYPVKSSFSGRNSRMYSPIGGCFLLHDRLLHHCLLRQPRLQFLWEESHLAVFLFTGVLADSLQRSEAAAFGLCDYLLVQNLHLSAVNTANGWVLNFRLKDKRFSAGFHLPQQDDLLQ